LWFALHFLFSVQETMTIGPLAVTWPVFASLDLAALLLSAAAMVSLFYFRVSPIKTLAGCAVAGMVIKTFL
jgi:chromate transporter